MLLLLHTTKGRTTTNLKTNNQNCQKIKLQRSLNNQGVKEETFVQTGRRGRDRQWEERTHGKAAVGRPGEAAAV